ncbi:hypothetical protein SH668x_001755 [Planctomicrobium sp. SH668]|uniref:hypothetical protein n=1 Tax=Planctomicrobium sp. SH668 TaxID=3448126 RepID=UPI003F5BEB08
MTSVFAQLREFAPSALLQSLSVYQDFEMRTRLPFVLICLAALCGCNSAPDDAYKGPKGTVSGKVTLKGKPLPAKCMILFQAPATGYTATGQLDENGAYSLVFQGSPQIPAVDYLVQLSGPPDELVSDDKAPKVGPRPIIRKDPPFPVRYTLGGTSGLKHTVKSGENKDVDFDLK